MSSNSFKVFNPIQELTTAIDDIYNNPSQLYDATIESVTVRNTSSTQNIKLTFEVPIRTIEYTDLITFLTGIMDSTIYDYTGGTVSGQIRISGPDTTGAAANLISQFRLTESQPTSVFYIKRQVSGGSTSIVVSLTSGTFTNIMLNRITNGILRSDSANVSIWTNADYQDKGYYVYISALDTDIGSERVRIIFSQDGPRPFIVTGCRYVSHPIFDQLDFMQTIHPDYNLSAWTLSGNLEGMIETYSFAFCIQQSIPISVGAMHQKFGFIATAGYNSASLQNWKLIVAASNVSPTITENPWSLSYTNQPILGNLQNISCQVVSGTFGTVGAQYKIKVTGILDLQNIEIMCTDIFGVVSEGFGPATFMQNWLTPQQQSIILNAFNGSVQNYLASGIDNMIYQGSYYSSIPLLQVDSFQIVDILTGTIVDNNNPVKQSVLWMDNVVQSYDNSGLQICSTISWNFFGIQFVTEKVALMITQINSSQGVYYIANLFRENIATIRWNYNNVQIIGSNPWTSPNSGATYNMNYTINLSNPSATINFQTKWNDQEIKVSSGGTPVYKYEGVGVTLPGTVILGTPYSNGVLFMELARL